MIKRSFVIVLLTLTTSIAPIVFKDDQYKLKKLTERFQRLKKKRYSKHTEYALGRIVDQLKNYNMFTQAHEFEDEIRQWIAQAIPHKVQLIENIIDQSGQGNELVSEMAEEDLDIKPTNQFDEHAEDKFQKKEENRTDEEAEKQSVENLQIEQGE